jgi:metal-responsive CopG/Arc/MetJ family transcriptional regulator
MQRTQVYLDPGQTEALDRLARSRGTTRSELLRLAAQRFLAEEGAEDDPIYGIVGLGSSGATNTSDDHDKILIELMLDDHAH